MCAQRDPFGETVAVVAMPLTEVDETLDRLLLVEAHRGRRRARGAGRCCAWVVVGIGLRPLDRMGDAAGAIAGGDLSTASRSTDPRTEVGRLGMSLNAMLDQIEEAFAEREASEERLRRFIADASHELRTPLASIRGYAELFRMGAARDSARPWRRRCGGSRTEAARMGVLVEDLLTLARLDAMAEVPFETVGRRCACARHGRRRVRGRAWSIAMSLSVDDPVQVHGDAHALRQVLGNLLRNALVHTDAAVDVSVGRVGAASSWPCATTGPACRLQRRAPSSSNASGEPRAAASAARAAPAWAWR